MGYRFCFVCLQYSFMAKPAQSETRRGSGRISREIYCHRWAAPIHRRKRRYAKLPGASTLGDPFKWEKIYEANKETMNNPHYIYVGQRIVIPS